MNLRAIRSLALAVPLIFVPLCARPEAVRTLRAQIAEASTRPFAVENLLGTMRVTTGSEDAVVVVATVHAENDRLASAVRLEEVRGDGDLPTLRVRYPTSPRVLRYPRAERNGRDWSGFALFSSSAAERYDGQRYRISTRRGALLFTDLEVRVPARVAAATYRQHVGLLDAAGLAGKLSFRVVSADLRLERLSGDVDVEGTSGDTRASRISGTWRSDFSSGDCEIERFEGASAAFHTSSGDVGARGIAAGRLTIDTSSGDADIRDADVGALETHSSSGDLTFESTGRRLARVRAESSSGNVRLELPADASFQADADQSSGEMRVRFGDGERRYRRGDLVSFRRGTGGADIRVSTSSGDLTIDPR